VGPREILLRHLVTSYEDDRLPGPLRCKYSVLPAHLFILNIIGTCWLQSPGWFVLTRQAACAQEGCPPSWVVLSSLFTNERREGCTVNRIFNLYFSDLNRFQLYTKCLQMPKYSKYTKNQLKQTGLVNIIRLIGPDYILIFF
jgi:hypothetical protein